jgi:hypothetical protein
MNNETLTNIDAPETFDVPASVYDNARKILTDPRTHLTATQRRQYLALLAKDVTPARAREKQFAARAARGSDVHFVVRLEKRSLRFLLRQQAKLARLLASRDRLLAELGGNDSMAARLVARDGKVWEHQLAMVQALVKARVSGPGIRDARPKRVQRLAKQG